MSWLDGVKGLLARPAAKAGAVSARARAAAAEGTGVRRARGQGGVAAVANPSASRGRSGPADEAALRCANEVIETEQQLAAAPPIIRPLGDSMGLARHVADKICPLLVGEKASDRQVVLLVTTEHRASDEMREVAAMLKRRGYRLLQGVNVFPCTGALLLAVARGQIGGAQKGSHPGANAADKSGLWGMFVDMVSWGVRERASDIHINIVDGQERSEVRFTIDDKYVAPERWRLPTEALMQMCGVAYQESGGGSDGNFIATKEQQCNIALRTRDTNQRIMLRWASFATDDGPQVTMRIVRQDESAAGVTLDALGYLPSQIAAFERARSTSSGAIVLAGKVNSGKSRTLATLASEIPSTRKLVTIEDPREFIIPGAHANTIARPLDGDHTSSFQAKTRTLKRSALNDLLLSEIRDEETGEVFTDAILAGTRVFTTTHATSAIGIIEKLASDGIGVKLDLLATPGHLRLMVYQALLPKNCVHCRISGETLLATQGPAKYGEYLARLKRLYGLEPGQLFFRNEEGCEKCRRDGIPELNGLDGRTVVAEVIESPDMHMLELIKSGDALAMYRYQASLPRTGYQDADMTNKSALECAIYKMSRGVFDPRQVEDRFESFALIELKEQRERERVAARHGASSTPLQKVA